MPSLTSFQTTLVADRTAKLNFLDSEECVQCIDNLQDPANASRSLGILALASREPLVADKLSILIDQSVLDSLIAYHRTAVLRLMASIHLKPSHTALQAIEQVLQLNPPMIDDISAAQFAAKILNDAKINLSFPLNVKAPPLYLAAQLSVHSAASVDPQLLWTWARSPHNKLRLSAASKLAALGAPNLLPFVAELIPDPHACDIAAQIIENDENGARMLADAGILGKLLVDPTPETFKLCAAAAQTDDLRDQLIRDGAIQQILKHPDSSGLALLLPLTRSVRSLRTGAATSQVANTVLEAIKSESLATQIAAMSVACNLVLEMSPVADLMLSGGVLQAAYNGVQSKNRDLKLNSIWLLKHTAYSRSSTESLKMSLLASLGINALLESCDCGDEQIEDAALGLLRNYLCFNPSGVELWLTEAPVDLWELIDRKLRQKHTVNTALYVLVHIAGGTKQHQDAILARHSLLQRVAYILDDTCEDETRLAGVWLLTNLYAGRPPENLALFKPFLLKCRDSSISVRSKAESLINSL